MDNQISEIEKYLLNCGSISYTLPIKSNNSSNSRGSIIPISIGETDSSQNTNNILITDKNRDHKKCESILQNVTITKKSQTKKNNIFSHEEDEGTQQIKPDLKYDEAIEDDSGPIRDEEGVVINKDQITRCSSNYKQKFNLSKILPSQTKTQKREKIVTGCKVPKMTELSKKYQCYSADGQNEQINEVSEDFDKEENVENEDGDATNENIHLIQDINSPKPYKCNTCHKTFRKENFLVNHFNRHNGLKPFKCGECSNYFTTNSDLKRHFKYRHSLEKPHKCLICDYACVELTKLQRHMRLHTGDKPYKCTQCKYETIDRFNLSRHIRVHTGEKPYKCDICDQRFTQSNSFKAHKLRHERSQPIFRCDHCPLTCNKMSDLKKHIMRIHTIDKHLVCNKCGQHFSDKYLYKVHAQTHENQKCFKCEICPYSAVREQILKQHMMIHTGERPYKCDICSKTFKQKTHINSHYEKVHHTMTTLKEKNYTCSHCQKAFALEGCMNNHMHRFHKSEVEKEDEQLKINSTDSSENSENEKRQAHLTNIIEEETCGDLDPPASKRAKIIED